MKKGKKSVLKRTILFTALVAVILITGFCFYVYTHIDRDLDESLFKFNGQSSVTKIYYYDYEDRENRIGEAVELVDEELFLHRSDWVSVYDMPSNLKNAFIAIEDKRFFEHKGVDWLRSAKAIMNYFFKFDKEGYGGSTITQQLIKNVTGENEATPKRKLQEILRALSLEKRLSKNEILESYLNIVYMSQNCYGVSSAANLYFGKKLDDLTLAECATLASIVQNPSKYDPYKNLTNNEKRRNVVLSQMLEQGLISEADYKEAKSENVAIKEDVAENRTSGIYSWYTEALIEDVCRELARRYDIKKEAARKLIIKGGFNIYSVMNPGLQGALEDVYEHYGAYLNHQNGIYPQSSCVIIDPNTSDVLALVGGIGKKTSNLVFNRATSAKRPPGSVLKPLSVYSVGIEEDIFNYSTVYDDTPAEIKNGVYWPKNSPDRYRGLVPLCYAVEHSINTVAVKALRDVGADLSIDYLKKFKISTVNEDKNDASLALGQLTYGESLLNVTNAYTTFANGGTISSPKTFLLVTDSVGREILKNEDSKERVISKESAYIMTMMLKGVVENGTASFLKLKNTIPTAGKTGTSSNNEDKWFVGYTPYYVCGVWTGFDNPASMSYAQNPSCVIFDAVMERAHRGLELDKDFLSPPDIVEEEFCFDSGMLPKQDCLADERENRINIGYYKYGAEPREHCDKHEMVNVDSETGLVVSRYLPFWKRRRVGLINYERPLQEGIYVLDEKYLICNRRKQN